MRRPHHVEFPVGGSGLTQFQLCKTTTGAVACSAATDECFGIVQDGAAAGSNALFVLAGTTKAIASAAISKGAKLMPSTAGRVVTHDDVGTSVHVGTAQDAATAAGDVIEIELHAVKVLAQA